MKRQITASFLAAAVVLSALAGGSLGSAPVYAAQSGANISVVLNGELQRYAVPPVSVEGVTYMPMRSVCEDLGAGVDWSQERKEAILTKDPTTLIIKIGSPNVILNNKLVSMGSSPVIKQEQTLVPMRFVCEALGAEVKWNAAENQISIASAKEPENEEPDNIKKTATESAMNLLSYQSAKEKVRRYDSSYQNALIAAERAKIGNDSLTLPVSVFVAQLEQQKQALSLNDKVKALQVGLAGETAENSIKNQMDDLSLMVLEKENLQGKIDFLKYKKKIDGLKFQNGMLSGLDWKKTQNDYDSAVQELAALEKKIDGSYITMNTALGLPVEQRDSLEYEMKYEPIGEVDLDRKTKETKGSDPYLWIAKQNVKLSEFNLQSYVYNAMAASWDEVKLDITQAKTNAQFTEQNLEKTIQARYNQLLQMEENLKTMEIAMEQARRSINTVWLQYDMGLAVKVQVEEAQRNIPDLEYKMKELKQQHEQLKGLFENPYLAPEYFSAGS